jgi:peptidoglycan/LPS O-acetylase OafA/YrhL
VNNLSNRSSGYLPTLDGWRAIAIVSVMLTHDRTLRLGPLNTSWFQPRGAMGVDVFFAISGILICSRLLEEERLCGTISIKNFYLRRVFRILPAAGVYLITIVVLSRCGFFEVPIRECVASFLFLRNYPHIWTSSGQASWFTGHFWSLAVEEHFYLLLPALLVFLPKKMRLWVLLGFSALIIVARFVICIHRPTNTPFFHTEVRLDELFMPAALALFLREYTSRWRVFSLLRFWPLIGVGAVIAETFILRFDVRQSALALLLPLLVAGSILHADNPFGRLLELPAIRFVGKISYGVYIWQQLFLTIEGYGQTPLGFLQRFPYDFVASFACALVSFYCVEKPMIRLAHRLAPAATPGR